LRRGHDAHLFAIRPDQANGADANLLIDAQAAIVLLLLRMTIEGGNTSISFQQPEQPSADRRVTDGSRDPPADTLPTILPRSDKGVLDLP
jgi:hypothetical protein